MIFKFMLSHVGMFGVFVKLGVCDFQIYAESYKSVARMPEVFVQLGECVFQNYAESCQSVLSVCTVRRMCFSKLC